MNVETREVRDHAEVSEQELESGKWIKLPKGYVPKTPVSDSDYKRLLNAEAKRLRKQARYLSRLERSAGRTHQETDRERESE